MKYHLLSLFELRYFYRHDCFVVHWNATHSNEEGVWTSESDYGAKRLEKVRLRQKRKWPCFKMENKPIFRYELYSYMYNSELDIKVVLNAKISDIWKNYE